MCSDLGLAVGPEEYVICGDALRLPEPLREPISEAPRPKRERVSVTEEGRMLFGTAPRKTNFVLQNARGRGVARHGYLRQ